MFAYIGCRTTRERNAHGEGISVYRVNQDTAELHLVQLLTGITNPSFLALNAAGDRLYAIHGDTTSISAYTVDRHTGFLAHLNSQDTQGKNPVHLAIEPGGQFMVVSNHIGASLAVLPIAADGSLEKVCQLLALNGEPGPHRTEQKHAKPHHNPFSLDGRYVIVPDKGLDRIFSYRFNQGQLVSAIAPVATREAAGPRHIVFHPYEAHAYCINELDSTVTTYHFHDQTGKLVPQQILSTLPDTFTGNSRAAELVIDPSGHYLYATNRGHDSIAIFAINQKTGMLECLGHKNTGGRTPRFITLTPDAQFLYALNEESDNIRAFKVDRQNGGLDQTNISIASGSPVCMIFSN